MLAYYDVPLDLDYIFYNKENKSIYYKDDPEMSYWEHVRKHGEKNLLSAYNQMESEFSGKALQEKMTKYSVSLKNMATAERAKEMRLMKQINPEANIDDSDRVLFLRNFNEIVQGQDRFKAALKRVIEAIELGKQTNKKGEYRKDPAPDASIAFLSNFNTSFAELANALGEKMFNELNGLEFDMFIERVVDEAIEKTFNKFKEYESKKQFGKRKDYEGLTQYLHNNQGFYDFVKSYFKIDKITNKIKEAFKTSIDGKIRNKDLMECFEVEYDGRKTSQDSARSLAGFVREYVSAAIQRYTFDTKGFKSGGNSISSNIASTDTVTYFSASVKVDMNELNNIINEGFIGSTQEEIYLSLKDMYNKLNKKKYSDLFVIHGSDKLRSMADSFDAFNKTQHIRDIKLLVDKSGIGDARLGHLLTTVYYNTLDGAVLNDKAKDIKEILRVIIAAVAGNLLFSDWTMIGYDNSSGATQIHVFDLDGVFVPLSDVLFGMSKAMEDFGKTGEYSGQAFISITNFGFGGHKEIEFPASKGREKRYSSYPGFPDSTRDTDGKMHFIKVWQYQRTKARQNAVFRINFIRDFKRLVDEIRKNYI